MATERSSELIEDENSIKINLNDITTTARWFTYNSGGVNIKYFAVKDKNGEIKTAFDACDVCYRSRKWYRQQGEDMVCNNCGNHYPITGLGKESLGGGCWPGYLKNTISNGYVVIQKKDIDSGRFRFA